MAIELERFQNLAGTQNANASDRIVLDGNDGVTINDEAHLGNRVVRNRVGGNDNINVRQELLDTLNATFKTGIPKSVLKAMNVSRIASGYAVKNGRVEVSDHPLTMRRLREIMETVDRELNNGNIVIARGAPVNKEVAASGAYKLLTGSLDALIAPAKAGRAPSSENRAKNLAVVRDVVALFTCLARAAVAEAGSAHCTIGGKQVELLWDAGGKNLSAKVSGTHLDRFGIGTDVGGLLARLADEIGSRADLFDDAFGELLVAFRNRPEDLVSVSPTLVRNFCERVIQDRAGVSADRLANVTTANLLDIAKDVVYLHERAAGGITGSEVSEMFGDGGWGLEGTYRRNFYNEAGLGSGFEMVTTERELVEARVLELEKIGERSNVSSNDANTLIDAFRADAGAAEKIAMEVDFNLEKKVGFKIKTEEQLDQAKRAQELRDFAADLLLAEDSTIHDQAGSDGKELAAVLERHANTLARLMIAYQGDPERAFKGVNEAAREILRMLLEHMPVKGSRMELHPEPEPPQPQQQPEEAGGLLHQLANALKAKTKEAQDAVQKAFVAGTTFSHSNINIDDLKDGDEAQLADKLREEFQNIDDKNLQRLGLLKHTINVGVNTELEQVQEDIKNAVDEAFKADEVQPATDIDNIDQMMANAAKPGNAGYASFVKDVLSEYLTSVDDVDKRALAAAMLRYAPEKATDGQNLAAMLKGAGPLLQKMLQGLDSNSVGGGDLGDAIKDMKKNLAPIPEEVVKASLRDIVERSGGKITGITALKTLGCASVGQAILCVVTGPDLPPEGKKVVVKILRPDALRRIEREKGFIMSVAERKRMTDSYKSQLDSILEEFDFKHEASNIDVGKVYDKGKAHPRTHAVKVEGLVSPSTMTLMMECAPGDTAEDVFDDTMKLIDSSAATAAELKERHQLLMQMQKDLCDLSRVWVTEGLYGSGFFHGDLHGGNIMLDARKGTTMIDFGNVTQLTESEQNSVTRMMTAATLDARPTGENYHGRKLAKKQQDYDAAVKVCVRNYMEGLRSLLTPAGQAALDERKVAVEKMLAHVLSAGGVEDAGKRIFVTLTELQRMGVDIPGPIFKFSQSQMRLQGTIDKMNDMIMSLVRAVVNREALPGLHGVKKCSTHFAELCETLYKVLTRGRSAFEDNIVKLIRQYDEASSHFPKEVKASIEGIIKNGENVREELERLLGPVVSQLDDVSHDDVVDYATLSERWAQLLDVVERNGKKDEALTTFVEKLATSLGRYFKNTVTKLQNRDPFGSTQPELETFIDCMGKVITQNLWATKKRLPMELVSAVKNN